MHSDVVSLRLFFFLKSLTAQLRQGPRFPRVKAAAAARAGESPTRVVGHDHPDAEAPMAKNDDDKSTHTPDPESSPPAPAALPTSAPKKQKRRRGPRREPKQWFPEGFAPGDMPL